MGQAGSCNHLLVASLIARYRDIILHEHYGGNRPRGRPNNREVIIRRAGQYQRRPYEATQLTENRGYWRHTVHYTRSCRWGIKSSQVTNTECTTNTNKNLYSAVIHKKTSHRQYVKSLQSGYLLCKLHHLYTLRSSVLLPLLSATLWCTSHLL